MKELTLPLTPEQIASLHAGDEILLNGYIYTARDAAHKRMMEEFPFDLKQQTIYYVGPSQAAPNQIIGSAGPTTATRMDPYTPTLFDAGLQAVIGKGKRSLAVKEAIQRNHSLYFVTIGGLGALLQKCIKEVTPIAYPDLGPEAINRCYIEKFPVFVGIDIYGGDIYD